MNCFRIPKSKSQSENHNPESKAGKRPKGTKSKSSFELKDGNFSSRTVQISSKTGVEVFGRSAKLENGKVELKEFTRLVVDEEKFGGYWEKFPEAYSYTPAASLPVSKDNPFYNMNHPKRGKAVIFNFDRWDNTLIPDLELTPRKGSEKDKNDLEDCLKALDFEVETYDNYGNLEMWEVLKDLRNEDHSDKDCLFVAVMTHGERNTVYMRDGTQIPVNLIWENFEANRCPTLAGKPKIFIIQACRGVKYDSGTHLIKSNVLPTDDRSEDMVDSASFSYVIPNAADILVAFSCPLGHFSWRNPENGSWFIQALCKILRKHAYELDFQSILTYVSREVALNYQSNTTEWESNKKKQVPSTSSTLIRSIRFTPKVKPDSTSVPSGEFSFDQPTEPQQTDQQTINADVHMMEPNDLMPASNGLLPEANSLLPGANGLVPKTNGLLPEANGLTP